MNKYWTNQVSCQRNAQNRQFGALPYVNDANLRPIFGRREAPLDVHAFRDTPDVPESDGWLMCIHLHQGEPPRRPIQTYAPAGAQLKGPICGHLHCSAGVAASRHFPEANEAIMRKVGRPILDVARQIEDSCNRSASDLLVHGAHRFTVGHRAQIGVDSCQFSAPWRRNRRGNKEAADHPASWPPRLRLPRWSGRRLHMLRSACTAEPPEHCRAGERRQCRA